MPVNFDTTNNKGCLIAVALIIVVVSGGLCWGTDLVGSLFGGGDTSAGLDGENARSPYRWSYFDPGVDAQLNDIFSPKEGEAWACGTDGTIVHTDDGGESWEIRPSGTGEDLDSIFFTDSETGFAAGSNGAFVRTDDAGKTWLPIDLPVPCMRCVYFMESGIGYAVGNYGTLYRSEDGGDTWTQQDAGVVDEIVSVFVADPDTAYFVTEVGLWGTTDGGETWTPVEFPGISPQDVAIDGNGRIWIVGDDGIYYSDDGTTFQKVEAEQAQGAFGDLAVNGIVYAGATNGWVIGSADGGQTWERQEDDGSVGVTGLFHNVDGELWVTYRHLDSISSRIGVKFLF